MNAAYYAKHSAVLYAYAVEIEASQESRDPYANTRNTAASYLRLAGAKLRELAEAMAAEEGAKQP